MPTARIFASGKTEQPGGVVLPASGRPPNAEARTMGYRREIQFGMLLLTTGMLLVIIVGVLDATGF